MTHEHTHHTPASHTPAPQVRLPWYRTWTGLAALGGVAVGADDADRSGKGGSP